MDQTFVFLDLETTGFAPDQDDIIEIGALKVREGEVLERFISFVKPAGKLPPKIVNLTGINDSMLQDAPTFAEVRGPLLDFIGDLPIVGHNISFDLNFINAKSGVSLPNPRIDTLDLAQIAMPCAPGYRLETLRDILGINGGRAHRAIDDAEASCSVFFSCIKILRSLDHRVLLRMYELIGDRQDAFSRLLAGLLYKNVAAFPAAKGSFPFAFMKSEQHDPSSLFPASAPVQEQVPEMEELHNMLGPAGPFAQNFPRYNYRPGQIEMLKTVARGFAEDKHMIVEAGTGTGKSLAYLVPAAVWAVQNNTKVVIATHTINLQEQLWHKDLPTVRDVAGINFKAALVKGRSNYLCLRRWESRMKQLADADQEEIVFFLKTLVWLTDTVSGDRSELNILPAQYQYWNDISSDQDNCLGPSCPWFNRHCFVSRARRNAEDAHLLVVNHSLLLADIKVQNRLLPAYDYLIIDEAHHLEDSATEQLGWTVSTNGLRLMLLSLHRGFSSKHRPGLFRQLKSMVGNNGDIFGAADLEKFDNLLNEGFEKVRAIHEAADELEQFLGSWTLSEGGDADEDACRTFRIKNSHRESDSWQAFASIKDNLAVRISSLIQTLQKIIALLESLDREKQKVFASIMKETEFHIIFFEEVNFCLQMLFDGPENYVFWVETERNAKGDTRIRCAPVSVSNLLYEHLFQTKRSTLLTSATISVDGGFDHFIQRIGLAEFPPEQVLQKIVPSPFCYEKQSLLCIARDIPEPGSVCDAEFVDTITPVITDVVRLFQGKTLVLFTSHRMLQEVYSGIQPVLGAEGITVLGHKIDGGRARLIEEFRKTEKAVLLGASSLWEGIDLSGDVLKCVILVRLPFSPPNSPVVEARIEELSSMNKDAFYSYMVPDAVIRLKQGFGRLIRSEEDEGVIVVLDRRIVNKRYGRKFLNSLPIKTHFKGDTPTILQKITDWLGGQRLTDACLNLLENTADLEKFIKKRKQ